MDTITLISNDRKTFKLSEYQSEMFVFPKSTHSYKIKDSILLGCNGEIVKLLLDHAEVYMYRDKEKVYGELLKYVNSIKIISKMQRFALINLAQHLSYSKLDSLVKLIKLC